MVPALITRPEIAQQAAEQVVLLAPLLKLVGSVRRRCFERSRDQR